MPLDELRPITIGTFSNHIHFYSPVTEDKTLDLIQRIRELDEQLRSERITRQLPDDYPPIPIWLHVQSYGGDAFAGLAIAEQIQRIHTPIYTIVEGVSASAATLLTLSGTQRYIYPTSLIMIHQLQSFMWGSYEEIKDGMVMLDALMEHLINFYQAHSELKPKKIKRMLKHDTWITADDALKFGLVDHIL